MNTHIISDTSVMLGRSMRHITRSPDTIITTTIMPIAFMLLFVYVFGGASRSRRSSKRSGRCLRGSRLAPTDRKSVV